MSSFKKSGAVFWRTRHGGTAASSLLPLLELASRGGCSCFLFRVPACLVFSATFLLPHSFRPTSLFEDLPKPASSVDFPDSNFLSSSLAATPRGADRVSRKWSDSRGLAAVAEAPASVWPAPCVQHVQKLRNWSAKRRAWCIPLSANVNPACSNVWRQMPSASLSDQASCKRHASASLICTLAARLSQKRCKISRICSMLLPLATLTGSIRDAAWGSVWQELFPGSGRSVCGNAPFLYL